MKMIKLETKEPIEIGGENVKVDIPVAFEAEIKIGDTIYSGLVEGYFKPYIGRERKEDTRLECE